MTDPNLPIPGSPVELMYQLRMNAMTAPPESFGIRPAAGFPRVYGTVMDWALPALTITVVALCDGTASLYSTSTFGVLGGSNHASIRRAACNCVRIADHCYEAATPTQAYDYPTPGCMRVYILGFEAVRSIDINMSSLCTMPAHVLQLVSAAQQVLSELRVIAGAVRRDT